MVVGVGVVIVYDVVVIQLILSLLSENHFELFYYMAFFSFFFLRISLITLPFFYLFKNICFLARLPGMLLIVDIVDNLALVDFSRYKLRSFFCFVFFFFRTREARFYYSYLYEKIKNDIMKL